MANAISCNSMGFLRTSGVNTEFVIIRKPKKKESSAVYHFSTKVIFSQLRL